VDDFKGQQNFKDKMEFPLEISEPILWLKNELTLQPNWKVVVAIKSNTLEIYSEPNLLLFEYHSILKIIDRYVVGIVRARDVNPTPADLGGVTSVLYELEHCCKPSLPESNSFLIRCIFKV
jgi:hypothetical protein